MGKDERPQIKLDHSKARPGDSRTALEKAGVSSSYDYKPADNRTGSLIQRPDGKIQSKLNDQ
jgi:hypothetical protein